MPETFIIPCIVYCIGDDSVILTLGFSASLACVSLWQDVFFEKFCYRRELSVHLKKEKKTKVRNVRNTLNSFLYW